jgi:hypothetical protein
MDNQTNQLVAGSNVVKKQKKNIKLVTMPVIGFLALALMTFATGCSGGVISNVKDAFSSSNDAVDTGIKDGANAVNDGVNDGTDAIADITDDIEDEFQTEANLVSVAVTPATDSIKVGATKVFIAKATYLNGSTRKVTSSTTWSSGTTSVATTSGSSTVIGIAVGTSVITANYLGKTGTATLTVTAN